MGIQNMPDVFCRIALKLAQSGAELKRIDGVFERAKSYGLKQNKMM